MMRKFVSFVLALVLALSALPARPVFALETDELKTAAVVNPLYKDVLTTADLGKGVRHDRGKRALASGYLSEEEAGAIVREAMKNREATVSVAFYTSENHEYAVFEALYAAMEHTGVPTEGDYLMTNYDGANASYYQGSGIVDGHTVNQFDVTYTIAYSTTAAQEAEMDVAVAELLATFDTECADDYTLFMNVYDYICENVTYDYANLNNSSYKLKYTAYAALMHNTAVCQGYAALLYRLMLELGIDCRYISGYSGGAHGWNIVQLGGLYYNADSTWDAGYTDYSWCLKNMSNFTNHSRDSEYKTDEFYAAYPMGETNYVYAGDDGSGHTFESATWHWAEDYSAAAADFACVTCGTEMTIDARVTTETFIDSCVDPGRVEHTATIITRQAVFSDTQFTELAPQHIYTSEVTAPTCTQLGFTTYTCRFCNGSYDDEFVDALGHDYFSGRCMRCTVTVTLDGGACGDDLRWELDGSGVMTIAGSGTMYDFASASDAPWQDRSGRITKVIVEDGVASIGAFAFRECSALTEVVLPAGVETIGDCAFSGCTALETVSFAGDAPTLGSDVFGAAAAQILVFYYEGSDGFDSESWADILCFTQHVGQWIVEQEATCDSNGQRAIDCAHCQQVITEVIPGGHNYDYNICTSCGEVEVKAEGTCGSNVIWKLDVFGCLTISGTGEMKNYGYYNYAPWIDYRHGITAIVVEDGVTSIGKYAFRSCYQATNIVIADSVTSIGYSAFYDCDDLGHVLYTGTEEQWSGVLLDSPDLKSTARITYDYEEGMSFHVYSNFSDSHCNVCDIFRISGCVGESKKMQITSSYSDAFTLVGPGMEQVSWKQTNYSSSYGSYVRTYQLEVSRAGTYSLVFVQDDTGSILPMEVEIIAHDLEYSGTTQASCSGNGYDTYKCRRCDALEYRYTESAQHHTWDEGTVTQVPTCVEEGVFTYTCTDCGSTKRERIACTDHRYADGVCQHCGQESPVLMGDANSDGVVNYLDAMVIAQLYVGDIEEDGLNLDAADVNGDGVVNYLDAMMVAQFYVGDIDEFPAN